jgi:exosome complex component RRP42
MTIEVSNLNKEMLMKMFSSGKRFDGRGIFDLRDFEIELGVSNKAEGSARVRMGKTEVIAGVKLELGEPYNDSPDKGFS